MKNVKYVAKIALPLLAICIVTVAVLAAVNAFTSPVIAQNRQSELDANMASFFGEGIETSVVENAEFDKSVKIVYSVSKDGALTGYCFDVTGNGAYKGKIEVLVAIGADGRIIGISNVQNGETPSIGGRVLTEDYISENYVGHTSAQLERDKDVVFLSGATKTSTALNNAVKNAFAAYRLLSEGKEASE